MSPARGFGFAVSLLAQPFRARIARLPVPLVRGGVLHGTPRSTQVLSSTTSTRSSDGVTSVPILVLRHTAV
jgi:hypothetical protein